MTTAHILTPASLMALSGIEPDDTPALLHRGDDPNPFARVVEATWTDDLVPTDVAIAMPVLPGLATSWLRGLGPIHALAEPFPGQEVVLVVSRGLAQGVVLSTEWRARQPGECRAILVAPSGDGPFAVNGDSDALIVDPLRAAIVGMHTGQLDNVEIGGVRHPSLWFARRSSHC